MRISRALIFLLFCATASAQVAPRVSLRISNELEPPGGLLEMKVGLTEPEPILTGGIALGFEPGPLGSVQDVALFSPAGNVSGTAVVDGGKIYIAFNSPDGTFGTGGTDVAIAAVAIPVRSDANPGVDQSLLTLDPVASWWLDPVGDPYAQEVTQGLLTVGGSLSITDVVPGSAFVTAGSTVAVLGMGFQAGARVRIEGAEVGATRVVSPTRLEVTLRQDALMHGKRIRLENGARRYTYDSFMRSIPLGESSRPLLAQTIPIFPLATLSEAFFNPFAGPGRFSALAFKNPGSVSADISLEAYSPQGELIGSTAFTVPEGSRISREVSELFTDIVFLPGSYLRALSTVPVQMLGMLGDDDAGTVLPVDPTLP